jgi:hypothetical protein
MADRIKKYLKTDVGLLALVCAFSLIAILVCAACTPTGQGVLV